jgi:hypothetical protein
MSDMDGLSLELRDKRRDKRPDKGQGQGQSLLYSGGPSSLETREIYLGLPPQILTTTVKTNPHKPLHTPYNTPYSPVLQSNVSFREVQSCSHVKCNAE